ncbi:tetratricopeptide repeat protein [Kordia periserrulae]|uniref:Tetratricopeptide repeat protein n=1 Tax=Kordia periserrulae TaxID=701523 RepID=A0A2T6BT30_9FLAO|nr:tetratricopeptide repeat protein [Kordia periserrulae]PTX59240.1 tetratricopeptide repeat protein [Kordia periserrulae]
MRFLISFLFCACLCSQTWAQSEALAQQYYEKGEYKKAMVAYEKLYKQSPRKINYFIGLVNSHQQLEDFDTAETLLLTAIEQPKFNPILLVETGFNYDLKKDSITANTYYEKAVTYSEQKITASYSVGRAFEKKSLLDYALRVYKSAMEQNPNYNFLNNIARIYGEKGDIEKMFSSYLDLIRDRVEQKGYAQRIISQFLRNDPNDENNRLFRKLLLKREQEEPNLLWNELLSWLFIQQKQYKRAFIQEKAIYMNGDYSLQRIFELANLSIEDNDKETAREILNYIIENSTQDMTIIRASQNLLQLDIETVTDGNFDAIEQRFNELLTKYGRNFRTILLQRDYANFLAFQKNESEAAIAYLKEASELKLTSRQEAVVKLALGDILVYQEQFNQALIYFSQVQKSLKNDIVGQEARFRVARTSYYKGDFEWAETQLKVLKSSVSQLIANDALQLKLIISDNSLEDSTQTALKKYAKADLLSYQKKETEAIAVLEDILQNHKGEKIEDEALLMQAQLYEKRGEYDKARLNYQKIIEFYKDDILADDAYFAMAQLYLNHFDDEEKAKQFFEEIIFNHQDSIHYVEAQKSYRRLRGDAVN